VCSSDLCIPPIEPALCAAAQDLGSLEKTKARKYLPRIEQIDGNRVARHYVVPRLSFSFDAIWSADRSSVSSQASPHGPQRR
jgi:hypothetical protein